MFDHGRGAGSLLDPAQWRARLDHIVDMMREISRQTDPHELNRVYTERVRVLEDFDRYVSVSRRDLEHPWYRVTRDSAVADQPDPWKHRDRLPLLRGGLIADLIYGDGVGYVVDPPLAADDPGAPYLKGYRTVIGVPHFDQGRALNMVVHLRRGADFDPRSLPSLVWESNLFGRATYNLVLSSRLREANEALARELASVGRVQRSLLPRSLDVPGLDLAALYRPSTRAGGDSYDVFPRPDGSVGLLIADVAGHGAPAAVLMAVVHALAHGEAAPRDEPAAFLDYLDARLAARYSLDGLSFVTAFYGLVDPSRRAMAYSRAGHLPPRVWRRGRGPDVLDVGARLPLGLGRPAPEACARVALEPGDVLVASTDGVTDARDPGGAMFGAARLDESIRRRLADRGGPGERPAEWFLAGATSALDDHTAGRLPDDDQTLVVGVVTG